MKKKENRLGWIALTIGTLLTIVIASAMESAHQSQLRLAEAVVRLHVLANSDSTEDQILKYQVRDAVITYLQEELAEASTRAEAEELLRERMETIRQLAEEVVLEMDANASITVSLCDTGFPTKSYGAITLPAGSYRALRIEIGEAKGANWWCMLFPTLCFVEETGSLTAEDSSDLLSQEDEELIHQDSAGLRLRIRFKLIEWWAALFG